MKIKQLLLLLSLALLGACSKPSVELRLPENPTAQTLFAAEQLTAALEACGHQVVAEAGEQVVTLAVDTAADLKKEGFRIESNEGTIAVTGKDGSVTG